MTSFQERRAWFERYAERVEAGELPMPPRGLKYPCPCCGYPTLEGMPYEMCVLCWWENNGQDDPYADEVWDEPKHGYSLAQARDNFAHYLSMYAPDRDPRLSGAESEREQAAKRKMMEVFERLLQAAPTDRDALWREADRQQHVLDAELDRALREHERRKRKG